ncbi:hypothetical protein GCM10028807_23980 [Spirosoma daeguense]
MILTPDQIQIIKSTWGIFRNMNPSLIGDVFYSKLFMDYPNLRRSYPKDISSQYPQLLSMLSIIVSRLERPQTLKEALNGIGESRSWATVDHYRKIGKTLLWTLQQGLGTDWNLAVEEAWTQCIKVVIDVMFYEGNSGNSAQAVLGTLDTKRSNRSGTGDGV